jgi:hypothetical protein
VVTWYTKEEARADWLGAPLNDEQLQLLLDVSQAECIAFSPVAGSDVLVQDADGYITEADAGAIPDGHRWAHLQHARNIWNAQKVNPSGGFGDDTQGFALTPFPIDWAVKARLRPRVIFGGSVG